MMTAGSVSSADDGSMTLRCFLVVVVSSDSRHYCCCCCYCHRSIVIIIVGGGIKNKELKMVTGGRECEFFG